MKKLKTENINVFPIFNSLVSANQGTSSQNVCFSDWVVGDEAYVYCSNVIAQYI